MNSPNLENSVIPNRTALIALPSPPNGDVNELVLLDSKWLSYHRNIEGPFTIAKTKFSIDEGAQWTAFLGDGSRWTVLLSSDDIEFIAQALIAELD